MTDRIVVPVWTLVLCGLASAGFAQTDESCVVSRLSDVERRVLPLDINGGLVVECILPADISAEKLCGGGSQRGVRYTDANRNRSAARVLSRLDIDGDGVPDGSADSDGDGLPDNWELGGEERVNDETDEAECEEKDRLVRFSAPNPIVPGTPPTPVFLRLAVATNALDYDTDRDGLSDFIEVFGLMFLDENRNGRLDDGDEWEDFNGDGLPSPGEYPANTASENPGTLDQVIDEEGNPVFDSDGNPVFRLLHDFDGFVFTDPSNPDTDGDGLADGEDLDPLINPHSFGIASSIIEIAENPGDADKDNDGLGNGMDMGNDLRKGDAGVIRTTRQNIDNPQDMERLIDLFRQDLKGQPMPESLIEDLLGLDWNGDGLWRTTDIRDWTMIVPAPGTTADGEAVGPLDRFFRIEGAGSDGNDHFLYHPRRFEGDPSGEDLQASFAAGSNINRENPQSGFSTFGGELLGLGWQRILEPPAKTDFMPDFRVYGALYAWRVPGFDIDGDGFVGAPTTSAMSSAVCDPSKPDTDATRFCGPIIILDNGSLGIQPPPAESSTGGDSAAEVGNDENGEELTPFDDYIPVKQFQAQRFDGVVDALPACSPGNSATLGMMGLALASLNLWRGSGRRRKS